jgi:putative flippase GtrA
MQVQDRPLTRPSSTASRGASQLQALATNRRRAARRFTKFAIVGASGVPVTLGINYLLHVLVGMPLELSTALAVEVAIITNFTGNHIWTFRGAEERQRRLPFAERHHLIGPIVTWFLQPTVRRFVKFNAVSLVGLILTTAITTFLAGQYGPELRAMFGAAYFVPANLVGIGVAMVWNFLANVVWTWA